MSNISGLTSSQFYQLPDSLSGASTGNTDSSGTTTSASASSDTPNSSSPSSSSSGAYLVDLSPDAQDYLSNLLSGIDTDSSISGSSSSDSSTFTLSSAQQQKLSEILEKYENVPITQANYDNLQNDLQQAGLGSDQLEGQDQVQNFNATDVLISALNGNANLIQSPSQTISNEQTKASNYMSQVLEQWQSLQSNSNTSTGSATDTSS